MPFVSRVRIRNYKSIAECDVRLGPLTVLVGPNGSGKSNFMDALQFLCRAAATSPRQALKERGGLNRVLRQGPVPASSFSISVEMGSVSYSLEIGRGPDPDSRPVFHEVPGPLPECLARPRFYQFRIDVLRQSHRSGQHAALGQHGEGIGDSLTALAAVDPWAKARTDDYLSAIVQSPVKTVARAGDNGLTAALAANAADRPATEVSTTVMSDGTLHAVAVLTALFQPGVQSGHLPLIGIEHPETALHPAAAGVLFDALTEASERTQVIVTSHSADLLGREDLGPVVIRPVTMKDGITLIGEVDNVSQEIVRRKLYTLGELMRGDQLSPQAASEAGQSRPGARRRAS